MSSDSLIGQTLDNYRVISRLGRGGMATVYRARQVNMGRDVAIKVMSAELSEDPQYEARFEREAQVIAKLQHPRVLPVHDFGHQDEHFYLVMRLIEGESLYTRLMRGALPLDRAARYVNQIAEALDYAHSQGVIHRDLKPNNVLVDELDNLYLMDFGLAKMLAATQNLTQTGTVLGTPQYMAPEQWRGEPVDARTDVYSLGVMLYEMVVGQPPFESDTPFTLMYKHVNDPPKSPREALPNLPETVETVILKALAKDPADRYESAGGLARALTLAIREAGVPGAATLTAPPEFAQAPTLVESTGVPGETPGTEAKTGDVVPEQGDDSADDSVVGDSTIGDSAEDDSVAGLAEGAADGAEAELTEEPDEIVPPPARIIPPPPPIPVPKPGMTGSPVVTGAPDPRDPRAGESAPYRQPQSWQIRSTDGPPASKPPSSAVRRAFYAVDQGLESALEKAAKAAPPLNVCSDPALKLAGGVQYSPAGVPLNAPAQHTLRGVLTGSEELVGVLDVRGTHHWQIWKQALIGGLGLNILGGLLSVGMFNFLGWLAWIFLAVQLVRTWRGDTGRYYLGFTSQRVIVLPRDSNNHPDYNGARAVGWGHVERLRLTNRYVLLDMPDGDGGTLSMGALLPAEGDGGLGEQGHWLAHSPIPGLVAGEGFEVRDLQ